MQDRDLHNRIMEVLKGRIAMGAGDDYGYGAAKRKRKRAPAKKVAGGRKRVVKRKPVRGGAKRKPVKKGGAKKKNPWIVFLKKHAGKGWTRQKMLSEYKKHKKLKK